jgi:hypothetical protein
MYTKGMAERRRYRRYIVSGDVKIYAGSGKAAYQGSAKLVQFALGGMLMRGGLVLAARKRATARVDVQGYPYAIEVPFEVVGERNALMAVRFLSQPVGLTDLVEWLAYGDFPIAPVLDLQENLSSTQALRCSTSFPKWSQPADRDAALEFLFSARSR